MHKITTEISIPFHDVDAMGVVWHGHYAKYLEIARCLLLDSFDYGYVRMRDSGYAWPVVDMRIKYVKPLHMDQVVLVEAELVEWENRLKIKYLICDKKSGARVSKAHTVQMAVDMSAEELCLESPPILLEKLGLA